MARRRPSSLAAMRHVHGVGDKKLADYGAEFVALIVAHCQANELPLDDPAEFQDDTFDDLPETPAPEPETRSASKAKSIAFALFATGKSIEEVQQATGRARSTTFQYLAEFVQEHRITDPSPWLDDATFARICQAGLKVGTERLKPIFEALEGQVPYDEIRLALECLRNAHEE